MVEDSWVSARDITAENSIQSAVHLFFFRDLRGQCLF